MSLVAGATLLGGIGHLANFGQFVEIGQGRAYQREQMQWARRAYSLDSRALRIDLLNAVKEDVRDHHQTYASRIDTLLVVHTLLLTFALATLQYSSEFLPSSECLDCEEGNHPFLITWWVYSVSAILILPFWGIVMLIWSKLQLDHWLENSLGRLNIELRSSLAAEPVVLDRSATPGHEAFRPGDPDGQALLERVEGTVNRLGVFVAEHQDSFKRVWNKECRLMIAAAQLFLWVSCVLAILITSGMFWLFLKNNMQNEDRNAAMHFAVCTACGLLAPAIYAIYSGLFCPRDPDPPDVFEDCIEALPTPRGNSESAPPSQQGIRSAAQALLRRWPLRGGRSGREILEADQFLPHRTSSDGVLLAERPAMRPFSAHPGATVAGSKWHDLEIG